MHAAPPRRPSKAPSVLVVHASAELYGADRALLELMAGLRERGQRAHVVLPWSGPLRPALEALGVQVHVKNLSVLRRRYMSPLGMLNRACRLVSAVRFLQRLIREHGIDLVHSNTTAVFSGALVARWVGRPHVWHVHEITTRPRWFARLMAGFVARFADRAVFVSQAALDHMATLDDRVRGRAIVIHNGIDPARARGGRRGVLRSGQDWSTDKALIGMIGRINWWKGQGQLVDCAVRLATSHPQARFVMVGGTYEGDTQVRDELLARITAAGLQARVVVLDFRPDIADVLADLDIYVMPSTEPEPFGLVVLEAMAAALPVVGFGHGGVCEIVDHGVTGLLVSPGDTAALAAAIAALLDDAPRARAMGLAGRDRLDSLFTHRTYIDSFQAVYRELAVRGAAA